MAEAPSLLELYAQKVITLETPETILLTEGVDAFFEPVQTLYSDLVQGPPGPPGNPGFIPAGPTASRPAAPGPGQALLYFDTTLGKVIVHDGSAWVNLDGTSL